MDKETKKKQLKLSIIISLSVVLIPALIIGIIGFKQDLDKKKQKAAEEARLAAQVEVPNVVGMTFEQAKAEIEKIELGYVIMPWKVPQTGDIVTRQEPPANTKVDKGTKIEITIKKMTTEISNNFYKMRFKKTIPEFCESFNKALENEYQQLEEDTTAIDLYTLKSSSFSYYQTIESEKVKQYNVQGVNYIISIFTEIDSDNIVYACVGLDRSGVANYDNLLTFVTAKIYPAIISSLTDVDYSTAMNKIKSISEEKNYSYFNDNICYLYREQGTMIYMHIIAMNEEKYNIKILNKAVENTNSEKDQETSNNTALQETNPPVQETENIDLDSNNYIEIDMPDFIGKTNTEMIFRYNLKEYIVEKLYEQDLEGTTFNLDILKYLDEGTAEIQGNFTLYGTGKVTKQSPSENSTIKIFYDGDGNVKLGEDIKVFCDKATEKSETTELEINRK